MPCTDTNLPYLIILTTVTADDNVRGGTTDLKTVVFSNSDMSTLQ